MQSERNIWIGELYSGSKPKILILGESDYGGTGHLQEYLPTWFDGAHDPTFARIFSEFSGHEASDASRDLRKAFWDKYAFYNFVVGDVGPTAQHRPTVGAYRASVQPFEEVLTEQAPQGVMVLGKEQSEYSQPVLERRNIPHVVAPHPAWRQLKKFVLAGMWNDLHSKIKTSG